MAFGKLTISSESGEIEEFELNRPTTSIGRQPGNDIVLPTSAVSRYHAQFDVAEGQVFLVDLGTVNGTFVNDQQVEANGRVELKDGDVIQLGDIRLEFSSPRRGGTGPLSLNAIEHVDQNVPITLVLDDPHQPVAPGSFLQFALVIENHTGDERLFTVDADGMDKDWIRVNRREVRLAEDDQTEVLISVRPPRASTTRPGRYPLRVRVAYKDDPTRVVELLREVDVLVYGGMAMAMKRARQAGQFNVAVQNQGNEPLDLELSGYQVDNLLGFQFAPSTFSIQAGATQQIVLRVTPAREMTPGERVPFAAVAHSLDLASYVAPLLGVYKSQQPASSKGWLAGLFGVPVLLLAGVILVVLALAGLILTGILPLGSLLSGGGAAEMPLAVSATPAPPSGTPPPTAVPTPVVSLIAFAAEPAAMTFGQVETVSFAWQIDQPGNVQNYQLSEELSGELVPLSVSAPSVSRFDIPVMTLVTQFGWGSHDFTLTITGVDAVERSSTASVSIDPVLCQLQPAVQLTTAPGQSGGTVATPPSRQVVLGGKTQDGTSVQVWDLGTHALLGWAPTTGVVCPLTTNLGDFIVVSPGPAATNTPAG